MLKNSVIIFIFIASIVIAQNNNTKQKNIEYNLLPYGFTDKFYEKEKVESSNPFDQTNPLKLMFVLMIRTYQVVFSKQDGASCQFRPSCSHFGAKAIKEYGPIQGLFMTSDRLLRCNPYTHGKYPLAYDHYHNYDPLKDHVLWKK